MRLALAEGRITRWRELYDELTPRDVSYLDAFHTLEPWGDLRDDMRAAFNTSAVVASISGHRMDVRQLANYLGEEDSREVSPNAMAAAARMMCPGRSR